MTEIDCAAIGDAITFCDKFLSKDSAHAQYAIQQLGTTRIQPIASARLLAILTKSPLDIHTTIQRLSALLPENHIAWQEDSDDGKSNVYHTPRFSTECDTCNSPQALNGDKIELFEKVFKITANLVDTQVQLRFKTFLYSVIRCPHCVEESGRALATQL